MGGSRMQCDQFGRSFPDGLAGPGGDRLIAHLDACPTCRSRWLALRLGLRILREDSIRPSPGFEQALMARLAREARPPS